MRILIKVILILGLFFASTLLIMKFLGGLNLSEIEIWLKSFQNSSPVFISIIITTLLFLDLFIAIPTLSICILSGYLLGFPLGAVSSLLGTYLAGITGHFLCKKYGEVILDKILNNHSEKNELLSTFNNIGFSMILLSRATPILPEVSACLSGLTKMTFTKFITAWSITTIPYVLISSYSGSISSLNNPKPAIYTVIGISLFFWCAWYIRKKSLPK